MIAATAVAGYVHINSAGYGNPYYGDVDQNYCYSKLLPIMCVSVQVLSHVCTACNEVRPWYFRCWRGFTYPTEKFRRHHAWYGVCGIQCIRKLEAIAVTLIPSGLHNCASPCDQRHLRLKSKFNERSNQFMRNFMWPRMFRICMDSPPCAQSWHTRVFLSRAQCFFFPSEFATLHPTVDVQRRVWPNATRAVYSLLLTLCTRMYMNAWFLLLLWTKD